MVTYVCFHQRRNGSTYRNTSSCSSLTRQHSLLCCGFRRPHEKNFDTPKPLSSPIDSPIVVHRACLREALLLYNPMTRGMLKHGAQWVPYEALCATIAYQDPASTVIAQRSDPVGKVCNTLSALPKYWKLAPVSCSCTCSQATYDCDSK